MLHKAFAVGGELFGQVPAFDFGVVGVAGVVLVEDGGLVAEGEVGVAVDGGGGGFCAEAFPPRRHQ